MKIFPLLLLLLWLAHRDESRLDGVCEKRRKNSPTLARASHKQGKIERRRTEKKEGKRRKKEKRMKMLFVLLLLAEWSRQERRKKWEIYRSWVLCHSAQHFRGAVTIWWCNTVQPPKNLSPSFSFIVCRCPSSTHSKLYLLDLPPPRALNALQPPQLYVWHGNKCG